MSTMSAMHVSALLAGRPPAPVVSPCATVKELVAHLARHDVGAAVVSEDGLGVSGLVSERDVIRALRDRGAAALEAPVATVMNDAVPCVRPTDRFTEALRLMLDRRIRNVPVVENGRYVGLLSIRDIAQSRMTEADDEADALRSYIAGA